jgi:hypothetical protein
MARTCSVERDVRLAAGPVRFHIFLGLSVVLPRWESVTEQQGKSVEVTSGVVPALQSVLAWQCREANGRYVKLTKESEDHEPTWHARFVAGKVESLPLN